MIKSAQNITPAPLFDRLFALFADTLIQGVIVLIVTFCIALIPTEIIKTREYILNITYIVFVVLIGPIYNTIFLFKLGNTTPGKKLFDLYLLNFQDKSELGWGQIIFREVLKRAYYSFLSIIAIFVDMLLIMLNPEKRSTIDYISNTQVVKLIDKNVK